MGCPVGAIFLSPADFVNDHLHREEPARLLAVLTGNITNAELLALVDTRLAEITAVLEMCSRERIERVARRVEVRPG